MELESKSILGRDNAYVTVSNKLTEYAKIEYMLQMSLGTSTAVINNIETIAKSQVTAPFDKNVNKRKLQVVYCFVDTADLDKNTPINTIVNQGFPIGSEGRIFSTGLLKLEKSGASIYRVLLCKVAVGKSLCYPATASDEDDKITKSNMEKCDFDSVYLNHEEYARSSFYRHEYKIFDSTQVLPEYLIEFKFDDSRESNLRVVLYMI